MLPHRQTLSSDGYNVPDPARSAFCCTGLSESHCLPGARSSADTVFYLSHHKWYRAGLFFHRPSWSWYCADQTSGSPPSNKLPWNKGCPPTLLPVLSILQYRCSAHSLQMLCGNAGLYTKSYFPVNPSHKFRIPHFQGLLLTMHTNWQVNF